MCSGWGALRGTGPRATGPGGCVFSVPCEGQALALRGPGCVFFVARGPVSRDRSLILDILQILAILLQTIAIKVLTDLFSVLRLRSIDIKVFQTFASSSCKS